VPTVNTEGVTRTEQIRKARSDLDSLQQGLDKVAVVLEGAEDVAVLGEEARRRAPLIVASVLGVVAVAGAVVYLVRRRRSNQQPS
jgi:hypothetical protein